MRIDLLRKMIQDVIAAGATPRTILLTPADAEALNIPKWTKTLLGLKVVIASNLLESKVVPHFYDTVSFKFADEESDQKTREKLLWLQ